MRRLKKIKIDTMKADRDAPYLCQYGSPRSFDARPTTAIRAVLTFIIGWFKRYEFEWILFTHSEQN